jgi:hypothetical protein
MRRPDEVTWNRPWVSFCVGFDYQVYFLGANTFTICLGTHDDGQEI